MFHIIHIPQPMLSFYFIFWNFSTYEIYFHKIPGFQYFFSKIQGHFQVHFKFQVFQVHQTPWWNILHPPIATLGDKTNGRDQYNQRWDRVEYIWGKDT